MIVDACIPPGAAQWEAFYVLATLGITELLGEAKIDRVECVSLLTNPDQEVVRLDIAVEEALQVNLLYSGDCLVGDKEDGLERELSAAVVEQVLERRAESVNDQSVEVALLPEPSHSRDTNPTVQRLVCLLLVSEYLGIISNEREFYGDLLAR